MTASGAPEYSITRLQPGEDLDGVVALEATSFTNPWSREMLERDLANVDVARVYVLRDEAGRLIGFCGCWFIYDELQVRAQAAEHPDSTRVLDDRFGFEIRGIRRDYYTKPVEDALVLWSEKLGFLDSNPEP